MSFAGSPAGTRSQRLEEVVRLGQQDVRGAERGRNASTGQRGAVGAQVGAGIEDARRRAAAKRFEPRTVRHRHPARSPATSHFVAEAGEHAAKTRQ